MEFDLDVISWHGLSRVRWVGIRTETKDAEKNRISQIMKQTEFEKTLRRVGKTATGFPARSQEAQALKRVCEAYIYVHSTDTARKFAEFMMAKNRELTAAQRLHLRAIGIDPDS